MISQDETKELAEYFSTQPVDAVYLFGSQATGKATKLSDYDIGVLFKEGVNPSQRFDLKGLYSVQISGILKAERVDVVDLEKAPIVLQYSAISPRVEIYVSNNPRRVNFEAEVMSEYFDYAYFLKQNTQYSLNSIAKIA